MGTDHVLGRPSDNRFASDKFIVTSRRLPLSNSNVAFHKDNIDILYSMAMPLGYSIILHIFFDSVPDYCRDILEADLFR